MIFYTNRFIPAFAAGCMKVFLIPVIFIRPQYKDDAGLIAHEKKHAEQAWRCVFPPIHAVLYMVSKSYRLAAEVEAYREQMLHYDDDRSMKFAKFIAEDYGLSITQSAAHKLLTE